MKVCPVWGNTILNSRTEEQGMMIEEGNGRFIDD
jgi:hypothetical protein